MRVCRAQVTEGFWPGPKRRGRGSTPASPPDQQTLPMQLRAMRAYAKQRSWSIGMEVRDVGSGANVRPEREAMLKAARRRELDIIMVWRLDRWGAVVARP